MFGVLIATFMGIQPLCTQSTFVQEMGPSLSGENEFVARAVFNDYLEQSRETVPEDEAVPKSPKVQLAHKLSELKKEIARFEELLDSLSVLQPETGWARGIANLRRTILLQERSINNPWNGAVWVDVPSLQKSPDELIFAIDTFLIQNSAADQKDRFDSVLELRFGQDPKQCIEIEKRVVARWCAYYDIIEPFMTPVVEHNLYPELNQGNDVRNLYTWILKNTNDNKVYTSAKNCFDVWKQVHEKQKNVIVSLVLQSRKLRGIVPWSQGCGAGVQLDENSVRITLLRHSAEINEVNKSAIKTLLKLLTDEQISDYESDK